MAEVDVLLEEAAELVDESHSKNPNYYRDPLSRMQKRLLYLLFYLIGHNLQQLILAATVVFIIFKTFQLSLS
ncbi:hypothetical protein NL676_022034 [Syzygium grande]|nr:hypothetical protein NL676_022034 [Syzygium grande]